MFNLLPKDTVFFDLFEGLAQHAIKAAQTLLQLAEVFPEVSSEIQKIREIEHAADDLAHQALDRLDSTFITPFDREDIHDLVGDLDTIIDNVDAVGKRLTLYHVSVVDPAFLKMAAVLVQSTQELSKAVSALRKTRKLSELQAMLIEVHRLENSADDLHHKAISRLFDGSCDPLHVMKWKELLDYVENAIDGCEDVGNTLQRIILKNG